MRMRGGMGVPSDITTVVFKLMIILKLLQALAKCSYWFCKCISEWATRTASSANSSSRISTRLCYECASATSVEHDSILIWRNARKKIWKNMLNNVAARTEPCLTSLHIGKVLDMESSNWTLAFMFSWTAKRMESSVWGQSNSVSMLYKPARLTVSKALVKPKKSTYSGRECSTLFSWSCLNESTMPDVLLEGQNPHWLSGRILSALCRTLGKSRQPKTLPAIHKSETPR